MQFKSNSSPKIERMKGGGEGGDGEEDMGKFSEEPSVPHSRLEEDEEVKDRHMQHPE